MKNFKNMLIMLPLLLVVLFASCKKDSNNAGPNDGGGNGTDNAVVTKDLLDYYIVAQRKAGAARINILYFTQDGNAIKANMNGKGFLRSTAVTISGSTLKFDTNGDGVFVYTFAFEKGTDGKVKLKSYQYTDTSNPDQGLVYATLANKADAPAFENSSFKSGDILLKFNTANNASTMDWDIKSRQTGTKYYPPPINQTLPVFTVAPEVSSPYYTLLNVGWKSNNDEFIGASVPAWNNVNTPVMLIERNSIIYLCSKQ